MNLPNHGARSRPPHLKVKDHVFGAITPFDWSKITEDPIGNVPGVFGIKDREQGGSSSCTVQATGYGFAYVTGIEICREDVYAKVALPGGGAYLNAPLDYGIKTGFARQSQYPDPSPETEENMTKIVAVKNGDRLTWFLISYKFFTDTSNIDSAAQAIQQFNYIHLGIRGSWQDGWNKSWVDPVAPAWNNTNAWQHALFAGKESVVLRNGNPTIKAKSSWNEHTDYMGNPSHCHYLNKNYFANGGVFEIIGVSIKELPNMQVFQVTGEQTLVIKNGAGKYYEIATTPDLFPLVKDILGLQDDVQLPQVTRDEVNAHLAGQTKPVLAFIEK